MENEHISKETKTIDVSSFYLQPESDIGNWEYKYKLTGLTKDEIENRITQLNFRLEEGNGEAIYEIGVTDDGCPLGITKEKLDETLKTLKYMAEQIDAIVQTVDISESPVSLKNESDLQTYIKCNQITDGSAINIEEKRFISEILIRRNCHESTYIGLRIAVAGSVDASKCLGKGTKVMTSEGYLVNVENIAVGDFLMGDDATPRKVLEITQGCGQLYKIIRTKGDPIIVNNNHILCLKTIDSETIKEISFADFVNLESSTRSQLMLYKVEMALNHSDFSINPCITQLSGIDKIDILDKNEADQFYGFELDGNQRFLLGDCTVTHNSTTIGVLTRGMLDDGNGKVRQHVFNFKHEIDTGRTSSVAQQILGFDENGDTVNEGLSKHREATWPDIVKASSKICTFYDMAGHEKYFNTTIRGISGVYPDYCLIMIGANMGIPQMTREHMIVCLMKSIPMIVVFSKIDIAPEHVCKDNVEGLIRLLKGAGVNKMPYMIKEKRDVLTCCHNIKSGVVVPILKISNVTGEGLDLLKLMLNCLPPRINYQDQLNKPAKYTIQEHFQVHGVGLVVSGLLLSGVVSVKNSLWLGPDSTGHFQKVTVKSIHDKRIEVTNALAGQNVCFALRGVNRSQVKRGMMMIDGKEAEPKGIREFIADIEIFGQQSTSVRIGYEPVIHISNIKQAAKIMEITDVIRRIKPLQPPKKKTEKSEKLEKSDKKETKKQKEDVIPENDLNGNPVLRAGDRARVRFRLSFHHVYFEQGCKMLFREGRTRGVGTVVKICD